MNIDEALAKATAQVEAAPSGETEQVVATPAETPSNEGSDKVGSTAQAETQKAADESRTPEVWDGGDVTKLPKELQEKARAIQRYTARLQQEAADTRKKLQELEAKGSTTNTKVEPAKVEQEQPAWTQAEYEDALLDSSGLKMQALVDRRTAALIQQAEVRASQVLTQVQQKQSLVEWEGRINDFRAAHPDFDELHKSGLMKPIFERVVVQGGGTLEDAYTEARKIADFYDKKATEVAQGRINQKKEASVIGKTTTNNSDVIAATDAEDAMTKAMNAAYEGKRIKVKIK